VGNPRHNVQPKRSDYVTSGPGMDTRFHRYYRLHHGIEGAFYKRTRKRSAATHFAIIWTTCHHGQPAFEALLHPTLRGALLYSSKRFENGLDSVRRPHASRAIRGQRTGLTGTFQAQRITLNASAGEGQNSNDENHSSRVDRQVTHSVPQLCTSTLALVREPTRATRGRDVHRHDPDA